MSDKAKYKPERCECCKQTTTYLLGLDRGSAEILLELLKGISAKGKNAIHPTRELDWSGKKKWFASNLSRLRRHGLIAAVDGMKGYYCLTKKAGKFLRGEFIGRYVVVSKVTKHKLSDWEPDIHQINLRELLKSDELPYWEGDQQRMIDYLDPQELQQGQQQLNFFTIRMKIPLKQTEKQNDLYDH